MAPMVSSWLHYPDRKGLISGIIAAGFGLGIFSYGIISRRIANPDNIPPEIFEKADTLVQNIIYFYFTKQVSDNVSH